MAMHLKTTTLSRLVSHGGEPKSLGVDTESSIVADRPQRRGRDRFQHLLSGDEDATQGPRCGAGDSAGATRPDAPRAMIRGLIL